MKKTLSRSLALAMALLMLLALAAPALAASTKTMIVTTTSAQVRSTPSQSGSNIIGKLSRHKLVTQTGVTGVWSIIEFEGKTAYVLSASLATYRGEANVPNYPSYPNYPSEPGSSGGSGSTSSAVTVYTTGSANVRKGPGTNYSKIAQLSKGSAVKQVGTVGNWAMIEWNDGVAYVSRSLLTSSGSSGGSTGGSTPGSGTVTATANVNVRSGPGTNYSIIGWLSKGESVTKQGTTGKWTIVSYNGTKGYISSSYLKGGGSTGGSSSTGQVLTARVYTAVRYGPGYSFRTVGYLSSGQTVEYLGKDGDWYRVRYGNSNNVYVYSGDVRFGSGGSSDPGYNASGYVYANGTVRVYESASTSSKVIGYLYYGDSAQRTGVYGSFTRIRYRGDTGYVLTSAVSSSSSGSSSTGNMQTISQWLYSQNNNARCYVIPDESSGFYHGSLGLNERVWAVEGNRQWTKIQVNGYTVYTRTSNLSDGYTGWNPGNPWNPGYSNYAYVYANTRVFKNSSGTALQDSLNQDVLLPENAIVRIIGVSSSSTYLEVQVSYDDNGTDRTTLAYIRQRDIKGYFDR